MVTNPALFDPARINRNTTMKNIATRKLTNSAGDIYYAMTDESGITVYSWTDDFEDIWNQDDQDAIEAGSTPSKL